MTLEFKEYRELKDLKVRLLVEKVEVKAIDKADKTIKIYVTTVIAFGRIKLVQRI